MKETEHPGTEPASALPRTATGEGQQRWPRRRLEWALFQESFAARARDEHAWMRAFAGRGELP
jgi:hypothetical protein